MKLSCPDCRGRLVPVEGDHVRCEAHGGEFQVLYQRPEPPPPPADVTVDPAAAGGPPPLPGMPPPPPTPPPPAEVHYCERHPKVAAVARCARCATWSCATCDFAFPGDIHLCPRCATEPSATLSPRRKQLVIWSYVLAGFATLVLGLLMAGALGRPGDGHTDAQALGLVYSVFIFLPALVGLGLSFSARERRLPNPPVLWGTLIWNVALCSLLTLLSIVGILRK